MSVRIERAAFEGSDSLGTSLSSSERAIRVYSAFIRNAFLNMLAYRLRYVTGILTYLLLVSVQYFIWQAVYAGRAGEASVNGYSLSQMITYVSIGWIARSFYHSNIDYEIDELVRSGQISIYLLRPVNFQLMLLAHAFGESLFRISCFSAPIAVVILVAFPVLPPDGVGPFGLFCLSTVLGFVVLAQVNFLTGLVAFSVKSIQGIMRAKYYLIQLFSGLLLPLPFFPAWAESILSVLPFKAIAFIPLQFYLGKVPQDEVLATLASQAAWIGALWLLGLWGWSRAVDRLTLQGG
ncbi:MAG: ABC-2 family transporter protein [Bdellovibrionales bacterium]|nr:ABC-2 family transporter protein [Bdellovibrionales bacterium]